MQAQVESTTTSANAKHWPTPAVNEAKERLTCFSTPSARSTVQNAARDVAIGGAAAAQKVAMKRKRGSQKNAKRVSPPSPPMRCKINVMNSLVIAPGPASAPGLVPGAVAPLLIAVVLI